MAKADLRSHRLDISISNTQIGNSELGRREDETCIYVSNLHEVSYIAKTLQGMRALQGLAVEAAMHITQTFTVLRI